MRGALLGPADVTPVTRERVKVPIFRAFLVESVRQVVYTQ
jgi:hypothetical protein